MTLQMLLEILDIKMWIYKKAAIAFSCNGG